jgi:hypothetical protein
LLLQAAGLALLAAVSPTALLVAAVYLGSAEPKRTTAAYLAGAVVSTTVIAVAVLVVLRAGHLQLNRQHQARYGLRLGLGLLCLLAAAAVARRQHRSRGRVRTRKPGFISRMVASPAPLSALASGAIIFGPSVTFLAAVQVVATSAHGLSVDIAGLALIVVIDVSCAWLPLAGYLIAPELVTRRLGAFNAWLRAHGALLATGALLVAGVIITVDGALGLA